MGLTLLIGGIILIALSFIFGCLNITGFFQEFWHIFTGHIIAMILMTISSSISLIGLILLIVGYLG